MCVDQHRSLSLAGIGNGFPHHVPAFHDVGPVALQDQQVGEPRDQLGDASAGGVDLHRDGDRVLVVLHDVDDRRLEVAGAVQAFPELALGGRAVPGGDEDHLVVPGLRGADQLFVAELEHAQSGLGGPDRLQKLRSRG